MLFDPDQHFVVVTGNAVAKTGVRKGAVIRRICSKKSNQISCGRWKKQPAILIDDGRVRWKVSFSEKLAPDGKKRMAFVVDADRYEEENQQTRSKFWKSS